MNANYAKICRLGELEAYFQQVSLVQFFWHFQYIVVKDQWFKFSKEKTKNIFLDLDLKKSFTIELA